MTDSSNSSDRREFLGHLAASAIVLAGTACAAPMSATQTAVAPTGAAPTGKWDDSWFGRLTAKHKAVFDSPKIDQNTTLGPFQAVRYINGMMDALGARLSEIQTVVVIRHQAIPFAFNDAMWEKYPIGESYKVMSGDKPATKNLLLAPRTNRAPVAERPQGNLEWFASNGHILLGCDLATQGLAQAVAEKAKVPQQTVLEDLRKNTVPGMILQPNGVYAVHRAQEAGCTFIMSVS
jgi:hypothetical protein